MNDKSVIFKFSELWTADKNNPRIRLPISKYGQNNIYVKGRLEVIMEGKKMPSMGYFGPDDVDIFDWTDIFKMLLKELQVSNFSSFNYQVPEQGGPVYHFTRQGNMIYSSILKSDVTGAESNPYWQNIHCFYDDLVEEINNFYRDLYSELKKQIPGEVEKLWEKRGPDRLQ